MDARKGIELLLTPGLAPTDWEQLDRTFRGGERSPGERVDIAAALGRLDLGRVPRAEIERQYAAMRRVGARLAFRWEDDYPSPLRSVPMPPPALFVRGRLPAIQEPAVAIVGTRKPSVAGSAFACELARTLALLGVAVVSGMARGIDTAAHQGALAAVGLTVAVLGTGVDVVYPPENGALMDRIAGAGGIVSEQMCGMQPFAQVFPRRNRIISGLSDAVVVVEGGAKSGALITARWALDQGRDVGAVPGFPGGFRSEGPNHLLKHGAFLVEDAIDVITNVKRIAERVRVQALERTKDEAIVGLGGDAARVYDLVATPSRVDDIAVAAGISIEHAQGLLTVLEIDGRIRRDEAGNYVRVGRGVRP
jgi:DNA processing protein